MTDTVDLVGVRHDGTQVNLGKTLMSPTMKARDIIEDYIGRNYHDEDSEENTALMICTDLVEWMKRQGWTAPEMKVQPAEADVCPKCGHPWEEHEWGVPSPYCPTKNKLMH